MQAVYGLGTLQITGALMALVFTTIGAGLLSLLVLSITHERLRVTQHDVGWTLRLFVVTLRRKILPLDWIDELEVVDAGGNDGTFWKLGLRSKPTTIRFGNEPTPAELNRISALIDERRGR